jgi:hypothetical protein
MEAYMELNKKTTVLFSHEQFSNLKKLAKARKRSIGELIRSACEKQYGLVPHEEALEAVKALSELSLPVGSMEEMKKQLNPLKGFLKNDIH